MNGKKRGAKAAPGEGKKIVIESRRGKGALLLRQTCRGEKEEVTIAGAVHVQRRRKKKKKKYSDDVTKTSCFGLRRARRAVGIERKKGGEKISR